MIGHFQENGSCTLQQRLGIDPVLNPDSWNNFAMPYVDQTIDTGFSTVQLRLSLLHCLSGIFCKYSTHNSAILTDTTAPSLLSMDLALPSYCSRLPILQCPKGWLRRFTFLTFRTAPSKSRIGAQQLYQEHRIRSLDHY